MAALKSDTKTRQAPGTRPFEGSVAELGFSHATLVMFSDLKELFREAQEGRPIAMPLLDRLEARLQDILAAAAAGPSLRPPQAKHLFQLSVDSAGMIDALVSDFGASGVGQRLRALKRNYSRFADELFIIQKKLEQKTVPSRARLKEPKSTFEEVARRAAELADDVRSLEPDDRARISEMLSTELGLSFSNASSGHDQLPFPVVPSSEVLGEKARRKPPKQKWLDRDRSLNQTPPDFIRDVYGDRLGRGFTQADLKACDKSCYDALHQWLRRTNPSTGKQNHIPSNVDLPSVVDWNARRVRQLRVYPESIDDDERQRLSYIIAGRSYRGNDIK